MPRCDRRRLLAHIERMLAATPPCCRPEKWAILAAFLTCLETWDRRQVAAFLAWDRPRRQEFFACLHRLVSLDDERRC
jgi:hypothetical protein